jgi:hypothetical protein
MSETEQLSRRQAEWQHEGQNLPRPEKIRQAERLRATVEAFRAQRRRYSVANAHDGRPEMRVPPETL